MKLIQNGTVYAPERIGKRDILVGGSQILAIEENIPVGSLPGEVETIDATDMLVTPGFIDGHQHFTGGGGEGGFETRTPEMTLSMNTRNGVTTAIGMLGTDSLTRSVEALYAKAQALNNEGMTAFMLTGSYWYPSPSITGDAARDLVYVSSVVGVKLALADIRGPHMDLDKLATLASDVRVAALVAGKPGFITVHVGIKPERLNLLTRAVNELGIRADAFVPTHVNRKDQILIKQLEELAANGGYFDATCNTSVPAEDSLSDSAADFAMRMEERGIFDRLMMSSDAGGSMPKWNEDKSRIIGMGVAKPDSLLFELRRLVLHHGMPLERALMPLTTTPATMYGLDGRKGTLVAGADADILIMEPDALTIRDVLAKGTVMIRNESVVTSGYFE